MQIEKVINVENNVAYLKTDERMITDVSSALDLLALIRYDYGCDAMILQKSSITEDFFDLRTGLTGEIVQKYVNYGMRLVVIGEFSIYKSKALHDFIYECNNGKDLYFVQTEEEAKKKLS